MLNPVEIYKKYYNFHRAQAYFTTIILHLLK